jgi:hypothetical protein
MFSFSICSVFSNFELDSPKTFQMDRHWITSCTGFTTNHEKGVQDFLAFLRTRYIEDEEYYTRVVDASITLQGL